MKIGKSIILLLCMGLLGLTACGEVIQPEENKEVTDELAASSASSLTVEKDGSIAHMIVEDFSGSEFYSEERLKSMIDSSIDEYTSGHPSAQIKLKNLKVKDGVANVSMEYGDYQAYAGFNSEDFFVGTVKDANMAGYDLNVTLRSVSDNTEISKPDLLGMGDSHIILAIVEAAGETQADQIRINCFDEILYVSDGITAAGKKSADVSLANGYRIIVFK